MYYDSDEVRDKVRIDVMRFGMQNVAAVGWLPDTEMETFWDAFLTAVNRFYDAMKTRMEAFVEACTTWAQRLADSIIEAQHAFGNLGITLKELGLALEPQTPRPPYWREVSRRPRINPIKPIDQVKAGRRMLYHQARRS